MDAMPSTWARGDVRYVLMLSFINSLTIAFPELQNETSTLQPIDIQCMASTLLAIPEKSDWLGRCSRADASGRAR
ncbi:hypothetical protein RB195_019963 [Necator americanus]|uniref:Uncharacterized protein n=1 Tax=Necator americanus TaxID=51031 RepID=A0ABR1CGK0_NECAM